MSGPDEPLEPGERPGERVRRRQAISVLRARLRAVEATWQQESGVDRERVARLEARMEDRRRSIVTLRYEITAARRRLEALESDERRARDELAGFERGLEAMLSEAIDRVETAAAPAWSPVPIVGYRMWTIRHLQLRGARAVWTSPAYEATCTPVTGAIGRVHGVPHSDGRCGRLGCGVYALKNAAMLLSPTTRASRPGTVLGAVALSGKVVEHELGYRAQRARVIAAGALWRERMVASDDPGWIGRLFSDPVSALEEPEHGSSRGISGRPRADALHELVGMLEDAGRKLQETYTTTEER